MVTFANRSKDLNWISFSFHFNSVECVKFNFSRSVFISVLWSGKKKSKFISKFLRFFQYLR